MPNEVAMEELKKPGAVLVCGLNSYFEDDIKDKCKCGRTIYYRPYHKEAHTKLCIYCAELETIRTGEYKAG